MDFEKKLKSNKKSNKGANKYKKIAKDKEKECTKLK